MPRSKNGTKPGARRDGNATENEVKAGKEAQLDGYISIYEIVPFNRSMAHDAVMFSQE